MLEYTQSYAAFEAEKLKYKIDMELMGNKVIATKVLKKPEITITE